MAEPDAGTVLLNFREAATQDRMTPHTVFIEHNGFTESSKLSHRQNEGCWQEEHGVAVR